MAEPALPKVSIIVAARNAATELPILFEALRRQTAAREDFELLVVDDRSTDDSPAIVEAEPHTRLIRVTETKGPYPARNVAARVARGALLAFTDADCVPVEDWVQRGIAAFEDPTLDHIAGDIRIPLGTHPTSMALLDAARHLDQELYVTRGYGATANMWVRRSVFESVGGFNDRLLSGGDREFGNRAVAAGHRLAFAPDVVVEHPPRSSVRDLAEKGFRIGIGSAHQVAHAEGPLGDARPVWRSPRVFIPPRSIEGRQRLVRAGHAPGPLRTLRILAVQYLFLTMPVVAGSLVGTLRMWREARPTERRA